MVTLFVMWCWQCWHAAEPIFTNLVWDQTLDMFPLDINKTASQASVQSRSLFTTIHESDLRFFFYVTFKDCSFGGCNWVKTAMNKENVTSKNSLQCWPTMPLHSRTAQIIKSCKLNRIQSKTSLVQYRVAVAILW